MFALSLIPPGIAFAGAWAYSRLRPWPVAAEICACLGVVLLMMALGTPLSYGAARLAMPLQDGVLAAVDTALGFDWLTYAMWCAHHPLIDVVQRIAYGSQFAQALFTISVLAIRAPGRNRETMTAFTLALAVTIAISAFVPALGPAEMHGYSTTETQIVVALRHGEPVTTYAGIIWFPSYHTAMAILFIAAHRGLPTFWPVAVLNAVMLTSIPNVGNHYLVDMIGGAAIAIGSLSAVPSARFPSMGRG